MSYIYIFYIHIVAMHAISISSTFYSIYILASCAYILKFFRLYHYSVLFYISTGVPFMLLYTLYFICTVPENIVVWRFVN